MQRFRRFREDYTFHCTAKGRWKVAERMLALISCNDSAQRPERASLVEGKITCEVTLI